MKRSRLFVLSLFLIAIGAGYIFLAARVFVPECYTQDDFFRYQLMTPDAVKKVPRVSDHWYFLSQTDEGSGLRSNEIVFTNIKESDAAVLMEQLDTWINNYPQRHETMSVSLEKSNEQLEIRVIHYDMDDNR